MTSDDGPHASTKAKLGSPSGWPPRILWWLVLSTAAVAAGLLAQRGSLPGGWLIGPLLVAMVASLVLAEQPKVSLPWFRAAQSVIGMVLASSFRPHVLSLVASNILPVVLVVTVTLSASVVSGIVLARVSTLSRETATFGTLPGSASGMIALSRDANADTRMVALMQYSRMVLVVLAASLLARFVLHSPPSLIDAVPGAAAGPPVSGRSWSIYLLTMLLAAAGSLAGTLLRFPAGTMLGSLILGILVSQLGWLHPMLPPFLPQAAYVILGLYVGLLFDRTALAQAGRLLPLMLLNIVILIAICAGMGGILSVLTGADYLTGYLATTPGGLDSVAIVALGSGGNVPLVLAVQMMRLFAVIFAGPVLARFVLRVRVG